MKRTISIIATISICASFVLCGSMSKIMANASGTGTELQVRPLITFEEDTATLKSYQMLLDNGQFNGLKSANNTSLSADAGNASNAAAKLNFGTGEAYSEVQVDALAATNKVMTDWSGAQYLQFWVNNTSTSVLKIDNITIKQAGVNAHYKFGSQYQTLVKNATTWTSVVAIAEKDNSDATNASRGFAYGGVSIPAGFEGFIRMSLNDFADYANGAVVAYTNTTAMTGFSFWYYQASGNNEILYMDDIAVVGQTLATDTASAAKTVTESTYFSSFYKATIQSVRPLITFEEDTATLTGYKMLDNGQFTGCKSGNNTSLSGDAGNASNTAAKINFGTGEAYSEVQVDALAATNKVMTDWNGARYLQFWVKNTSTSVLKIDNITIKQAGVNAHYKFGSQYQTLAKDATTWTGNAAIAEKDNSDATNASRGFAYGGVSIPAGFEGFIRMSLTDFADYANGAMVAYTNTTAMTGFSFWYYQASGNNEILYMDDIAVVGDALATDTESAVKTVTESTYFSSFYKAPIVDDTLSVRPLLTFEEDTAELTAIGTLKADGTFKGLHAHDSTGISDSKKYLGNNSVKVKLTDGEAYSEIETDEVAEANKPQSDWTGAEYLQFWVKNTSSTSVVLDSISIKQTGITNHYLMGSKYSMLEKGTTEWTEGSTIAEKDNGAAWHEFDFGAISISAGFEGFIRVNLSDFYNGAKAVNAFNNTTSVLGFSFWYYMANANNETFYMDDVSILGKTLASDTASAAITVDETDYFKPFFESEEPGDTEKVKVLTSFEANETALVPTSGINWVPYTFNNSTKFKYSGSQSFCARVSNEAAGMEPYSQLEITFPDNSALSNWEGAEYMMLWVKNNSLSPVNIGSFSITNIQNDVLQISAGSNAVSIFKDGSWVDTAVTTNSDVSMDIFTLPAYFEGFIRIQLDAENSALNVNTGDIFSIKFFILNSEKKSEIYFDDLSLMGKDLSDEGSALKLSTEYFGSYTGGIINDYNAADFEGTTTSNSSQTTSSTTSPNEIKSVNTNDTNADTIFIFMAACSLFVLGLGCRKYSSKKQMK